MSREKWVGAAQSFQLVKSSLLRRANTERKVLTLTTGTQQSMSFLMGGEGCQCLSWKARLCSRREGGWVPQHSSVQRCSAALLQVLCCGEPCHVSTRYVSRTRQHTALVVLAPSFLCWSPLTACISPKQSLWGKTKNEWGGSSYIGIKGVCRGVYLSLLIYTPVIVS